MVGFNKKAAILAVVAEGVTKPKQINSIIKERHGVDIPGPTISMVLYNHRKSTGRRRRRRNSDDSWRSAAGKKAWVTRRAKTGNMKIVNPELFGQMELVLDTVTGKQLVSAITIVNTLFGGDATAAMTAIALAQESGLCVPSVPNEG